ncbi:MAG: glyoxalase superfamily protein [Bacteroidota bacterium]
MENLQHTVIPVLRIFDIAKTKEFYIDWLGFIIDWEHRFGENFPLYMQVSKDNIKLHLTEHHGDCSPGAKVFIVFADGLTAYHSCLKEKDYRYMKPGLEKAPWDALTMEVIDPAGNKLLFSESTKK